VSTWVSRIKGAELNSAPARAVLSRLYRPGTLYRIPLGPLKGLSIVYSPEVNFHALLGFWERPVFDFAERVVRGALLPQRPVVCDIGGNLGLYSLWAARRLGPEARIYCFEPSPSVLPLLKRNLDANQAGVTLVEAACSDKAGTVQFYIGWHHHTSSLNAEWAAGQSGEMRPVTVQATSVDDYFGPGGVGAHPDLIKMDIEGGGVFALPGAARCLAEKRPLVLVESHTPAEDRAVSEVVTRFDYAAFRLGDGKWVAKPSATYPDREGIWGTLFLCPADRRASVEAVLRQGGERPGSRS
jgi:FkbM family methyltransferase